jgi:hypothetical protein
MLMLTAFSFLQAALPLTIYIPLVFIVFNVAFPTALSRFPLEQQYYDMLSPTLMYFPAALNSLFTILLIGHYRRTVFLHFCKFNIIKWKKVNAIAPVNVTVQQIIVRQNKSPPMLGIHGAQEEVVPPVETGIFQASLMPQIA